MMELIELFKSLHAEPGLVIHVNTACVQNSSNRYYIRGEFPKKFDSNNQFYQYCSKKFRGKFVTIIVSDFWQSYSLQKGIFNKP